MARVPHEGKQAETLDYMQAMLAQLGAMARNQRFDMLAYMIEMAYVEVTDIIRGERPARSVPALASRSGQEGDGSS